MFHGSVAMKLSHSKAVTQKPAPASSNESALADLRQVFQNVRTKADVLRALLQEDVLRRIPIEQAPSVSKEQAEKDFRRERVILNGVFFIPDKVDVVRCEAFALSLHHLVERLQSFEGVNIHDSLSSSAKSNSISDTILQRGCRTSAGADSFFMVQKLLCVDGTFVTQKTSLRAEDPIIVDVFLMYDDSNLGSDIQFSNSGASNLHLAAVSIGSTNSTIDHPSDVSQTSSCFCNQSADKDNDDKVISHFDSSIKYPVENSVEENEDDAETSSRLDGNNEFSVESQSSVGLRGKKSSLFARIEVKNFFSVYDISAMDELSCTPDPYPPANCGGSSSMPSFTLEQPLPWLEVETILIDESNFRTREHWRRIQLIVTQITGSTTPSSSPASRPASHRGSVV